MDNCGSDLKQKSSIDYAPQTYPKLHPSWVAFLRFCRELVTGRLRTCGFRMGFRYQQRR
jgi:hypothetical protein